jgi:hypothetical protein
MRGREARLPLDDAVEQAAGRGLFAGLLEQIRQLQQIHVIERRELLDPPPAGDGAGAAR